RDIRQRRVRPVELGRIHALSQPPGVERSRDGVVEEHIKTPRLQARRASDLDRQQELAAGSEDGGAGRLLTGAETAPGPLSVGGPAEITVASAGGIDAATRATIATSKHRVRFSIVSLLLFMGRVASDAWVASPPGG